MEEYEAQKYLVGKKGNRYMIRLVLRPKNRKTNKSEMYEVLIYFTYQ